MICTFCKREFDNGLTECPYCHKQVEVEPHVISADERDTFEGMTIEVEDDGTVKEEQGVKNQDDYYQQGSDPFASNQNPNIKVVSLGGSLLWTILFILLFLGFVFFLLPTFIIIAAIIAAIVFIARLFV